MDMEKVSIAPMMDWTDRHCRYYLRKISQETRLYTEMITADAVLKGDRQRLLAFDPSEHPLSLQLGGSDPKKLGAAASVGESLGYKEINLNVGCPSDRVQSGRFGVCLMSEPRLVAECVSEMMLRADVPVTVKTRTGVDERDDFDFLAGFVNAVADSGCGRFIVHARKAWLKGLSPKQNREVPPLNYARVYELKRQFPELKIIINGGILDLNEVETHLKHVDGVMLGRAAYHNAYVLSEVDRRFFASTDEPKSREEVVWSLEPYVKQLVTLGIPLKRLTRHMLGLYQGQRGARRWRRYLSEHAHKSGADFGVLVNAMEYIQEVA